MPISPFPAEIFVWLELKQILCGFICATALLYLKNTVCLQTYSVSSPYKFYAPSTSMITKPCEKEFDIDDLLRKECSVVSYSLYTGQL